MSARRLRRLRVLDAAERDLDDILIYTREHWGTGQSRRYRNDLRRAMNALRDFPELGPRRDDLYSGCRMLTVQQHNVNYRITDEEIVIGRLPHANQDPTGKVDP